MGLATRLATVAAQPSNSGCRTCHWLKGITPADREAFDDWIEAGHSLTQLWEICASEPQRPLEISFTGFRHHRRHHLRADT